MSVATFKKRRSLPLIVRQKISRALKGRKRRRRNDRIRTAAIAGGAGLAVGGLGVAGAIALKRRQGKQGGAIVLASGKDAVPPRTGNVTTQPPTRNTQAALPPTRSNPPQKALPEGRRRGNQPYSPSDPWGMVTPPPKTPKALPASRPRRTNPNRGYSSDMGQMIAPPGKPLRRIEPGRSRRTNPNRGTPSRGEAIVVGGTPPRKAIASKATPMKRAPQRKRNDLLVNVGGRKRKGASPGEYRMVNRRFRKGLFFRNDATANFGWDGDLKVKPRRRLVRALFTMEDMMGDRAEFKKRRGPLSAITKSKIARALRGKKKKGGLAGKVFGTTTKGRIARAAGVAAALGAAGAGALALRRRGGGAAPAAPPGSSPRALPPAREVGISRPVRVLDTPRPALPPARSQRALPPARSQRALPPAGGRRTNPTTQKLLPPARYSLAKTSHLRTFSMYDMIEDRAEFKKRRGPLSAITKSKIARALRGKKKKKGGLAGKVFGTTTKGRAVRAGVAGALLGVGAGVLQDRLRRKRGGGGRGGDGGGDGGGGGGRGRPPGPPPPKPMGALPPGTAPKFEIPNEMPKQRQKQKQRRG